MTQDEIIEMAKQAGYDEHQAKFDTRIEAFAKLVAEREREACAKVCDYYAGPFNAHRIGECTDAIRARGEA